MFPFVEFELEGMYWSYCAQVRLVPDATARMTGSVGLALVLADAPFEVENAQKEAVGPFCMYDLVLDGLEPISYLQIRILCRVTYSTDEVLLDVPLAYDVIRAIELPPGTLEA